MNDAVYDTKIESVIIPSGVRGMGNRAFRVLPKPKTLRAPLALHEKLREVHTEVESPEL